MAIPKQELLARKRARYLANRKRHLEYAATYRKENREKVKAARAGWYEKNRARAVAYSRKYYWRNHSHQLKTMRAWRAANAKRHSAAALLKYHLDVEAGRKKCRAYRAKDVERHRARVKKWIAEHPEEMRDKGRRRRARKIKTTVNYFSEAEVFERDCYRCYICEAVVAVDLPRGAPTKAVVEHVIPLMRGGTHTLENVRCACWRCNQMKGAHSTAEQVRNRLGLA